MPWMKPSTDAKRTPSSTNGDSPKFDRASPRQSFDVPIYSKSVQSVPCFHPQGVKGWHKYARPALPNVRRLSSPRQAPPRLSVAALYHPHNKASFAWALIDIFLDRSGSLNPTGRTYAGSVRPISWAFPGCGSLQGAWPFGLIEAIWAAIAVRRWRTRMFDA